MKDKADTFNEYFGSIVEPLDLYKWESEISDLGLNYSNQYFLDITIRKYEKHPSMQTIKQNFRITKTSFPTVFTFEILTQCINKSLKSGGFPDYLKQANISPIFKKDDPSDKDNYKCKKNYLIIDCLTM